MNSLDAEIDQENLLTSEISEQSDADVLHIILTYIYIIGICIF
jgi:hypothetical protein